MRFDHFDVTKLEPQQSHDSQTLTAAFVSQMACVAIISDPNSGEYSTCVFFNYFLE